MWYILATPVDMEWVFEWVFKWDICLNDLPHWSQVYGFTLLCTCRWLFKLSSVKNRLSHLVHGCGRIPWWTVFWWIWQLDNMWNDLLHWLQTYGFSPVCVRIWILRRDKSMNRLSHISQTYGRIPWWFFKHRDEANDLLHWLHVNFPVE